MSKSRSEAAITKHHRLAVVLAVKNRRDWVPSLGWEGALEEGSTTHSRMLTWRIPWIECGRL